MVAILKDIVDNPHRYKFKEVQQYELGRMLDEVDAGFLVAGAIHEVGYTWITIGTIIGLRFVC